MGRSSGRRAWIIVIVVVLVAALGVGGWLLYPRFFPSTKDASGPSTVQTSTSVAPTVADPAIARPAARIAAAAKPKKALSRTGVTAQIAPILASGRLSEFSGVIFDGTTGAQLWAKSPNTPQLPASTNKLLTGAALLTSVDPESRLSTMVVSGSDPGDIVFVGGGDVTLSARTTNTATVYPGAATVQDLVDQLKAKNVQVKRIVLDTDYWTGPDFAAGWDEADIKGGYITHMSPLMVDGDRVDPGNANSPRTGTPAETAGRALARLLGVPTVPLVQGPAPANAQVLAQVQSQPMSILLAQALLNSDNVLAEALVRQASIGRGGPGSFIGGTAAILQTLAELKIPSDGVQVVDGSGLSIDDKVPPIVLGQVLAAATMGKVGVLRTLLTGLPVAGVSGTLEQAPPHQRFINADAKPGVGWVRAKTGSVQATYAFAGYTPTVDGQVVVFAVTSNNVSGDVKTGTRSAQDAFATELHLCGCS